MMKLLSRCIHIIMLILTLFLFMAFQYFNIIGSVLILCIFLTLFLNKNKVHFKERIYLNIAIIVMIVIGCISKYSIKMISCEIILIFLLTNLIIDIYDWKNLTKSLLSKLIGGIGYFSLIIVFIVNALLLYNVVNPDALVIHMQSGEANYPENTGEKYRVINEIEVYEDVVYESKYPNNTYTVYVSKENKGVFFYIHGGGLVIGDKDLDSQNMYLNSMVNAGYSVVTVDYVLAPQNPYPQALFQVNEAFKYFVDHAHDYGLDTNRIIVGGDSSGAMLSGLLATVNTNEKYAEQMNITPALQNQDVEIKGFVSISGLVDIRRYDETGVFLIDWLFNTWGRSALQNIDFNVSEEAYMASLLEHVNSSFPNSYISDGNLATFTEQGKDLVEKLSDLGVSVEYNFPERSEGILIHDWELDITNDKALENFNRTIQFMDLYMK